MSMPGCASYYQATPQERAARAKELLAERIEKQIRVRILDAIRKKLPASLSRPDLEHLPLYVVTAMGTRSHRQLRPLLFAEGVPQPRIVHDG